ncbi:hypothetical protein [uncultured Pontibacter sp.]|uniref:hypothetical protein n=1 Tax=uncultured Pontibacter sp. TaxID=453356 RepID=UPI00262D01ED|nr:hypothetical protein [uncultured Pontibacter sp.]
MIITSILTLIGILGTLAIVACLKQMEDGMAELQEHINTPVCPICHIPHTDPHEKKLFRSLKKTTGYYTRKRKAISNYCQRRRK